MTALYDHTLIIGIGLIGSSLALAIKEAGLSGHISVADANIDHLTAAQKLSLGDSYHESAVEPAKTADLIVLCVPVGVMPSVVKEIADQMKPGATLSDTGSVKESVVDGLKGLMKPSVNFIPGHPVAGTEQSGPSAGFAGLFKDRWCILTPLEDTDQVALECLTELWQRLGSKVDVMDAKHHDLVLAITSHVPHLIAYNIVGTASDLEQVTRSEVIKYSAGGFRDFTRIAASDPTMWRDVFLNNKDAVLEMLGRFSEDLTALQRAIRWGDGEALHDLFTHTRDIRRRIVDAGQDSDAADFGRHHNDDGQDDQER